MTSRRKLLFALGSVPLLAGLPALAQTGRRVRRIGYLSGGDVQSSIGWLAAFREGMAELRWTEGRDYVIDARYSNGVQQALAGLAADLVGKQPDLMLAPADEPARALFQGTKTIPIVLAISIAPIGNGFAASLKRPGGNVTGLTSLVSNLGAKRLQLLKEVFPRVKHVVVLFAPAISSPFQVKEIEEAASRLKLHVTAIGVREAADMEQAFKRGATLGAQAYMMTSAPLFNVHRLEIADRMLRSRLPGIAPGEQHAEAGWLMSYAPSFRDNFRRAASYVDKILKGANPGDLPIEQPVKFELIVNLKTARAMGITFPQSILLRADRVIE